MLVLSCSVICSLTLNKVAFNREQIKWLVTLTNLKKCSTTENTGSIAHNAIFLLFNCCCWHWRAVIDSKSNLTRKIALWAMRPVFSVADLFLWLYFHAYSFLICSSLPAPAIDQEKNCIAKQWNQYFLLLTCFVCAKLKKNYKCNHFICSWLNATLLWQHITFNWATIEHIVHE